MVQVFSHRPQLPSNVLFAVKKKMYLPVSIQDGWKFKTFLYTERSFISFMNFCLAKTELSNAISSLIAGKDVINNASIMYLSKLINYIMQSPIRIQTSIGD